MIHARTTLLDSIRNKLTLCNTQYITFKCESCGEGYSIPLRCDLILCEKCGKRRFRKLNDKFYPVLAQFRSLKFLTLTWRKETVDKSEILLRHRKVRRLIRKYFDGGLYVFEGLAQHVHALVVGEYVGVKRISKTWNKLTVDSKIVYIKRANPSAVNYLLKYVCKPPKFDSDDQMLTYYRFWFRQRRISTVGILYNYPYLKIKFRLVCSICNDWLQFWCIGDSAYNYPSYEIFISIKSP